MRNMFQGNDKGVYHFAFPNARLKHFGPMLIFPSTFNSHNGIIS